MGGPAGSLRSRQHSSRGHRGTQAPPPRQRISQERTTEVIIKVILLQEVIKVMKSIKSTSGKISIKTTTKNSGEKHAYVQGVG